MNHAKQGWAVNILFLVVGVLATLLVTEYVGGGSQKLFAQGSGGSADYMIGLLGPARQSRVPLFLVDSNRQTIMVYDYHQDQRELGLRSVRTYKFDRELEDQEFGVKGPTVEQVKEFLDSNR